MPKWIPILIVLLTQGGAGAVSPAHPHELVRMLRYVAFLEDAREIRNAPGLESDTEESALAVSPAVKRAFAARSGLPSPRHWPGSGLTRDGPAA
ncbi:MAG: hypothetical protein JNM28_09295 [Armatimonadetes bacterium]|nr:hypothetical protein [Armatimonadota bacterium]MBS1710743.1 hypothetical protein [Armatimonadota bacterium]MBX3108414.1 hypothetical protein [Fimbriimonadaceae bacterium]